MAQQFVLGQIKKQDRKAAKLGQRQEILDQMNKPANGYAPKQMAAKAGRQQSTNIYALETTNRTKKVADYSKYFQSSSDEEDDYDSEGDNRRGGVSGRSQRAANRGKKKAAKGRHSSEESDGEAEISGEEEDESNEEEQEEQSGSSDDESEQLTRNRRRGRRAQGNARSGARGPQGRAGASNSNLNFESRAPRSSARGYGAAQAGKRSSRRLARNPGDDLLQRYGFKPSDIAPVSRSERARLRNLKRGVGTDDEDLTDQHHQQSDLRDDEIAEKMENGAESEISNSEVDDFGNQQNQNQAHVEEDDEEASVVSEDEPPRRSSRAAANTRDSRPTRSLRNRSIGY